MLKTFGSSILRAVLVPTFMVAAASAQSLPPSTPAAIDKVFADYNKADSPGCALAVYQNGAMVLARGYGRANLEHGVPITPQTVFDIGSTSKQFTAFSIMLLEQDGKLTLDDAVRKYIPELPAYEKPIIIRHLLHHTSGLRDYVTLWALAGMKTENWTTQDDAVSLVARQQHANFPAGNEYLYSNTGYLLLSEIVKRVSGKRLAVFAGERIFEPLGMKSTCILDDHRQVVPRRATGYSPREGGGFEIDMSDFEQTGDGAVQTTVEDLLKWDNNFYKPRVGDAALLQRMQTPGALTSGKALDYGAGLTMRTFRGLRTVRHGGAWAGYRAELLRFPDQQTSVACLCNLGSSNPSALADRVAVIVLADRLGPESAGAARASLPAVEVAAERLAAIAGVYESGNGTFQRLFVKDRVLRIGTGHGTPLKPVASDHFAVEGSSAQFLFPQPAPGAMQEFHIVRESGEPEVYRFVPAPPAPRLDDFVGRFYSSDLDATWIVAVGDGALTVRLPTNPAEALAPVKLDVFRAESGIVIRFAREGSAVGRAVVQAGRVTNLGFERR